MPKIGWLAPSEQRVMADELRERYGPSTRELVVRIQPGAALDRGLVLGFAVLVAGAMRWKR